MSGNLRNDITETNRLVKLNRPSKSTYHDSYSAEMIPEISGVPIYGFIPSNFRTYTAGAGTIAITDGLFKASSGATIYGHGTMQSFRTIRYKAGQGAMCRFGAYFPSTPTAQTWIGAGLFNIGDEISFGYNGVDFGIWHRHGGDAETQSLQITTQSSGSENATVTVNDIVFTVPLTSGTVQHNAFEIAEYIEANTELWAAEQLDDSVIISAQSDGDKTGTFSMSSGTAVGSFTELKAGQTKTSDFVAMSSWSEGAPIGFDPAKGNNYEICYKDGFGNIEFFIEDPEENEYKLVHTIQWANMNTTPNLHNPSLRCGIYAASTGATTSVDVYCSDLSAFVIGSQLPTRNPRSVENTKSCTTTFTNILTLRNRRVYNGHINQVEIEPREITLSNDGTKTAAFELVANPTIAGETNYQEVGTNLAGELDIAGGAATGGRTLAIYTVAKGQSVTLNLDNLHISIPPTLRLCIAGRMESGSAADLSASLVYYENV